ncbi:MAG: ArnT family glycosyltransferase [Candidatus Thorarchaeota archaeon]
MVQKRKSQGKKKRSLLSFGDRSTSPAEPALASKYYEFLTVILVCGLALILRIWNLDWAEFKGDEAFWCFLAEEILNELEDWTAALIQGKIDVFFERILGTLAGEGLPVRGQRKLGIKMEAYGGPIVAYLIVAGYYLFGWNPVAGTLVIASLNVLGVFLTYLVGRRLYTHQVGLMAALLLATSPWFVLYSRKIWTSVNFPWLIPLLLLALWSCAKSGRGYAYFVVGMALGIAAQLHLTGFALIPPALIFLLLYGKKLDFRNSLFLGVGGFLGHLPLIIFDLEEDWRNFQVYKSLITEPDSVRPSYSGGPQEHREEVFVKLWQLVVGSGLNGKLGSNFQYGNYDLPLDIAIIGVLIVSFFAIIWQIIVRFGPNATKYKKFKERQHSAYETSWKSFLTCFLLAIGFYLAFLLIRVRINGTMHQIRLFLLVASLLFFLSLLAMPVTRAIANNGLQIARKHLSYAPPNDFLLIIVFGFILWYTLYGFTFQAASVVHIHYLNVLFPIPFLIISRGLQLAANHFSKLKFERIAIGRAIPWILVGLIAMQNLIIVNRAFNFINDTGGEGEYGTTLASKQEAVQFIVNHSAGKFRVNAGYSRDFSAYEYLFQIAASEEIYVAYPYIEGGFQSSEGVAYTIIEANNHQSIYETYQNSDSHPLLARFKGVYVFQN